nr:hypothetical protein [Steroidobacter agaridevorans]
MPVSVHADMQNADDVNGRCGNFVIDRVALDEEYAVSASHTVATGPGLRMADKALHAFIQIIEILIGAPRCTDQGCIARCRSGRVPQAGLKVFSASAS